jgi:hypothetical protein
MWPAPGDFHLAEGVLYLDSRMAPSAAFESPVLRMNRSLVAFTFPRNDMGVSTGHRSTGSDRNLTYADGGPALNNNVDDCIVGYPSLIEGPVL